MVASGILGASYIHLRCAQNGQQLQKADSESIAVHSIERSRVTGRQSVMKRKQNRVNIQSFILDWRWQSDVK